MNALAGGPMSRGDVVTRSALSCFAFHDYNDEGNWLLLRVLMPYRCQYEG
jgi:hypothetical protein